MRNLNIYNTGNEPLHVTGIACTSKLMAVDQGALSIAAGQSLTFFVYSASNTPLQGDDGRLFTFRLRLTGTGGSYALTPEEVILSNAAGMNMVSDSHGTEVRIAAPKAGCADVLSFGLVPMEQQATASLTLHNGGELPLSVQRVEFSTSAFTVAGPLPVIAAGRDGILTVRCQPAGEGSFGGTMQIYTDDAEHPDEPKRFTEERKDEWDERLARVFNRGFWDGYYQGQLMGEWNKAYGSCATERKVYIGRGVKYFSRIGVAEFTVEANTFSVGDKLLITGPTTGAMYLTATEIHDNDGRPVQKAPQGQRVAIPVAAKIRPSDKLFKLESQL